MSSGIYFKSEIRLDYDPGYGEYGNYYNEVTTIWSYYIEFGVTMKYGATLK